MKHSLRTIVSCATILVLGGGLLTGCPKDDAADDTSATTEAVADGAASGTDDSGTDDAGTDEAGTDEGGENDSAAVEDICALITEDDVAALVGAPVTKEEDPGGGCSFDQEDVRAATVAFATSEATDDTDGSFNSARYGAFAVLDDPVRTEPGIGDYSTIATGTINGGENQQGTGIVQSGHTIVHVTVVQANGLDVAAVEALVNGAMTLAVSKL